MDVDFEFTGTEGVLEILQSFADERVANNMTKRVARHAMKPVRKAARENAKAIDDPETRSEIHKNIATRTARTKYKSVVIVKVGVQGGARNKYTPKDEDRSHLKGGYTKYWNLIEFGTRHIKAVPFMRNALSQNIAVVTNDFANKFEKEVYKELAKHKGTR